MCWTGRLTMIALPIALALTASSCGRWGGSAANGPPLALLPVAATPAALLRACQRAAALPDHGLRAGEVARLWGRDRLALAQCAGWQGALARHVRATEAAATPLP